MMTERLVGTDVLERIIHERVVDDGIDVDRAMRPSLT